MSHAPGADMLLIKSDGEARSVPATTTDRSARGHAKTAELVTGHAGSPASILTADKTGTADRHTHKVGYRMTVLFRA